MTTITLTIEATSTSCGSCRFLSRSVSALFTESNTCTAFAREGSRLSKLRGYVQRSGQCLASEVKHEPKKKVD